MIARYTPDISLKAWRRWFFRSSEEDYSPEFLGGFCGKVQGKHPSVFINGRSGLFAYFRQLKEVVNAGTVLIPAQICPVVTQTVAINGLEARFVDADRVYPTPAARQYREALDNDTRGIIISPLYGYLQKDWDDLFPLPEGVRVILDLAQGSFLLPNLDPRLIEQADAIMLSFNLGKGFDTGGALLLTSTPLALADLTPVPKAFFLGTLLQALILRLLIGSSVYPFFLRKLEAAIEVDKDCRRDNYSKKLAPPGIMSLWQEKVATVTRAIGRARERAAVLGAMPCLQGVIADHAFFDPEAMHLRQIIRCRDQARRDRLLQDLKRSRVDCAAAGEPLPPDYFPDHGDYPNAAAFRQEALRLPFLGRLSEKQFAALHQRLEEALSEHLS